MIYDVIFRNMVAIVLWLLQKSCTALYLALLQRWTYFVHSGSNTWFLRILFRLLRGACFPQKTLRFEGFYTPLRELDSANQDKSDRFEFYTMKTSELALFNDLGPF